MMTATRDRPAGTPSSAASRPGVLTRLLTRLWQRRVVVALSFGTTLFLAVGLLLLLPVSYVASGALVVADRELIAASADGTMLPIHSPRLLGVVLDEPGATGLIDLDCAAVAHQWTSRLRPIGCARLDNDRDARLHWIQDRFGFAAAGQGGVVSVTYRSPTPVAAQSMVNALLQALLADRHGTLRHSPDGVAGWSRQRSTERLSQAARRLLQSEAERRAVRSNGYLVSWAELPSRPTVPHRTPFLIGGLTMATLLAVATGLLTGRPVVAGPIALARTFTRIPILGQVPELRPPRSGKGREGGRVDAVPLAAAISSLRTHPPLLEALHVVHARLGLAGFGTEHRTLLVASEVEGEGKSFVTLALARMAHASGRRVLVIETCLRAPFIEEALGGPSGPGLAGYLRGGPAQVVRLGAVPGVDFLLAGDRPGDGTELLSGPRFRDLLAATADYDLVLIDSAPVAKLRDAARIAPQVDGVLFCLRAGRAPAVDALSSLPEMQRANGNVVGLVLTFVPDNELAVSGVGPTRLVARQRQLQADHA